jgi:hypothetical protein
MSRGIRLVEPATPRQLAMFDPMLKTLDELADLRDARITTAGLALPAIFWEAVLTLAGLMVVLAGFVDPEASARLTIGMSGVAIALLIALVIIIDSPFDGEHRVSPAPIQKAIAIGAERD